MNWINWQGLQPILFENIIFLLMTIAEKRVYMQSAYREELLEKSELMKPIKLLELLLIPDML